MKLPLRRLLTTDFWRSIGVNQAVVAVSVARLADAMGNSILFIVIPVFVKKLPDDLIAMPVEIKVGVLISLYGFVVALLQPPAGALSDRLGRRKILMLIGLLVMALGTVSFAFADRYLELLFLRAAQGVGIALTVPAAMAILASVTERRSRGGAMGFYTTLRLVGFSIGPPVGGFLQVHFGFDSAFFTGAGLLLLAFVAVQLWVPDVRVPPPKEGEEVPPFRIIDPALLSPGILAVSLATFAMAAAFSMVVTLENEFNARLGMTAVGFGVAFSALMVGRLATQVPLGRLSDYIGRKPLIVGGLLLTVPVTIGLGLAASDLEFLLLRVAQGVAAAAIAAPALALAGDLSGSGGEGRQMSVVTTGFGLGIAVGPLVSGLLAVFFFELPFLVMAGFCVVAALVMLRYAEETVSESRDWRFWRRS